MAFRGGRGVGRGRGKANRPTPYGIKGSSWIDRVGNNKVRFTARSSTL